MSRWRHAPGPPPELVETLRAVLEKSQSPDELDSHPWTKGPIVEQALADDPTLKRLRPGRRLLQALADLFAETMPGLPPRRGLRLDTQWGEFGLLAARYFAPLKFGAPFPASLRESWGRIDQAILLFVYGHANGSLSAGDVARYRLVGGEPGTAPDSTLSDWHRKGLRRLASLVGERQKHLSRADPSDAKRSIRRSRGSKKRHIAGRPALAALGVLLVLALSLGAIKGYRIYRQAEKVRADLRSLANSLPASPDAQALSGVSKQLPAVEADLAELQSEVEPFLWLGPTLRWVPTYGGDLAQAGDLLDLAAHLTASAGQADAALSPLLAAASPEAPSLSLSRVVAILSDAHPGLLEAQTEFQAAEAARGRINADELSPSARDLLLKRVDPAMGWMGDGLSLTLALPSVMGDGSDGPRTYLLLAQNEDELRPTGGFITAVGKLVLDQGHVLDLSFDNSGDLDNWSMPYPMAPWQLSQYMNSSVLILRDANWFPDFPTAVLYVKQLYAYTHKNTVDGVIAFDQKTLIMLLKVLGPLQVDGVSYPITADNVTEYMRAAKSPPTDGPLPPGWTYKAFVGTLAQAVIQKMLSGDALEWRSLSAVLLQALQQRQLLLQMDDPEVQAVLARRDWNGALSSSSGDFLMVVDSNVGFNKTNAVVDTRLSYDVDLSDSAAPTGELLAVHSNRASPDVPCIQWSEEGQITGEETYPIDRCFWDYMRVYVPEGTQLLSATPQTIPDAWMILDQHVPPRVDVLNEGWPGLAGFGTLLVVPGGGEQSIGMRFGLPPGRILTMNPDGTTTYQLTVRKQPGTDAVPLTLRVHLPADAILVSPSPDWVVDGRNLLIQTNLKVDLHLNVTFRR